MRTLIVATCMLVPLAAAADEPVRDDIVELRHGRTPRPHVFLGWTSDGRAVVHSAPCGVNGGGGTYCSSVLEVVGGRRGTSTTAVLQPTCGACDPNDPRWEVSPALAERAIRAERDALAALGPLSPSGTPPPVVKAIAGSCSISLDIAGHVHPRVIVMPSKRCMIEGGDTSYVGARVRDVELSPDGGAVAVTLSVDDRFMEWTSTTEDTIVVPLR